MTIPSSSPGWTLAQINAKVRSLTGTPSDDQLSPAQINAYINNYLVYTMPFELKVQIQNQFLDFKTTPGIDVYAFPGTFITDQPGAYADGFPLIFYQDPDIFYQDWPQQYAVNDLATGDGITSNFTGGLQNPPIIIGSAFFTDGIQVLQDTGQPIYKGQIATGNGGTAYSGSVINVPISRGTFNVTSSQEDFFDNGAGILSGNDGGTGTINYSTGSWTLNFAAVLATAIPVYVSYSVLTGIGILQGDGTGNINYATGAFTISFSNPPSTSLVIYAKYQGYSGNRPQGVLFYENQFTFRPVPDQVYQIRMQGFINPTPLVNPTDLPTQPEWGPVIAYGAAIEVFNDRGDLQNADKMLQLLKARYENIALSRTIQQYTAEQGVPRF